MEGPEVYRLGWLAEQHAERMLAEVLVAGDVWTREYAEYQNGGWLTATLLGASRDPKDTVIGDCTPQPTDLLTSCPRIARQLRDLRFSYMWVRVARMEPGASLWEHRDYQELTPVSRYRLHIPLATNPDAFLVFGNEKTHLPASGIFYMRPVRPHGACNLGLEPRIHLILDVYDNPEIRRLMHNRRPVPSQVLPELPGKELHRALGHARALIKAGRYAEAEASLLRLYFQAGFEEGALYEHLEVAYREVGMDERAVGWARSKSILLGRKHDA
jgi:hypothetical protein